MPLPAALQARLKKRGLVTAEPKPVIEDEDLQTEKKKKKKMSFKSQPLPPGWFKVPDPESAHDYYWNVHTNQVAWRHPNDPRVEITYPASWQQNQTAKKDSTDEIEKSDDASSRKEKQKVKIGKHPSLIKAQRQKERKKKDDDTLDPMDPASYSDIARGSWASGLRDDSEVNTGVDTTASGPLFQQRPYPSPGDILRRKNKAKQTSEEDEED